MFPKDLYRLFGFSVSGLGRLTIFGHGALIWIASNLLCNVLLVSRDVRLIVFSLCKDVCLYRVGSCSWVGYSVCVFVRGIWGYL